MVKYLNCALADIIEDAKENDRVDYLKSLLNKKVKNKKGEARSVSFLEIRRWYYEKYYSELLPVPKEKKKTMYDIIKSL